MVESIIVYPSYFDNHSAALDDFEETLIRKTLTHYASQLLVNGLHDEMELEAALHKAITALQAVHLPAENHFRKIFISYGGELRTDWLVSDLGIRLIMMNADVSNPVVARLQIEILSARTKPDYYGTVQRNN
jgi:hypothetical protein